MIPFHFKNLSSFFKSLSFLLFAFGVFFIPKASAQFTITENFKGSSVGSNIVLGGTPNKAILTSGNIDEEGDGWLRLTSGAVRQRGYAFIDTSFPSTLGVYIDFEYKTWRSEDDEHGGADGIAVFLYDGSIKKEEFQIGAYGGALGYANMVDGSSITDGLKGAYLGIGLDEYGNFANKNEGKVGGTNGLARNSIVLRGPGPEIREDSIFPKSLK